METRANYLLVGGFVLLFVAGLAAFVLWFAKLQFDVEFDRYDIRYAGTVTGLNEGSPVRYSGVRVGEVIVIQLDREDPSRVLVTIEVEAATPVREDRAVPPMDPAVVVENAPEHEGSAFRVPKVYS